MFYKAYHRLEGGIYKKPYLYLQTSYGDAWKVQVKAKYPAERAEPLHVQMLYSVIF